MKDASKASSCTPGRGLSRRAALQSLGAGTTLAIVGQGCAVDTASNMANGGALPPAAPGCHLTPADEEGPYYTPNAPARSDLAESGAEGESIEIRGWVRNALNCDEGLAGYLIDAWHADSAGMYDNQGYRLRGVFTADDQGAYVLKTVMPGRYVDRPFRHIHFKVRRPDGTAVLTSQVYFAGDPQLPMGLGTGSIVELEDGVGHLDILVTP